MNSFSIAHHKCKQAESIHLHAGCCIGLFCQQLLLLLPAFAAWTAAVEALPAQLLDLHLRQLLDGLPLQSLADFAYNITNGVQFLQHSTTEQQAHVLFVF